MRAGAFCDDRVIALMNRRFVNYYYNRSGKGEGGNADAAAFTRGRTKNPYAFFAAFAPDGTYLGETPLYGTKDEVFTWLRELLDEHPDHDKPTADEGRALEGGGPGAARLLDELGRHAEARKAWAAVEGSEARLAEARLARLAGDWDAHAAALGRLDAEAHAADLAAEKGHRLVASKSWAEAREHLEAALRAHPKGPRLAEMRFAAGVACWFLDDRDWAKFHWMWVVENLPEDRLAMRCRIAAAAEAMPYENPELGGFKARGMIGTEHIVREVARSRAVYLRLMPLWAG